MTFKHITWILSVLLVITAFSSCLKNNSINNNIDVSKDAQLYGIKAFASGDSTLVLTKTLFSIDQLQSQIYNKDSLDYGFKVKNVRLSLYTDFASSIKLYLQNPDSSLLWKSEDSVNIGRLKYIEVLAQDGKMSKKYHFKLNIHQTDPNILLWKKLQGAYISTPFKEQKTIFYNNSFMTFFSNGSGINLTTTQEPDKNTWQMTTVSKLPKNTVISSITSAYFPQIENKYTGYALDNENNVYHTTSSGSLWTKATTSSKTVKTIYGIPYSEKSDSLLTALEENGALKFAQTKNEDFKSFSIKNAIPEGLPVKEFTSVSLNNPLIYSAKYIIITGGKTLKGELNKKIWILQKYDNKIAYISVQPNFEVQGSTLFAYNNMVYLLTVKQNKNILMYSDNRGKDWKESGKNQAFPDNFAYRKNASIIVDNKNFIWIFGGTSNKQTQFSDVWRGRLNKLAVK